MSIKVKRLTELVEEIASLQGEMEADEAKNTSDNRELFEAKHKEAMELKESIRRDADIVGMKSFLTDPVNQPKSQATPNGDGVISQPFAGGGSIGEQFVNSESYKSVLAGGSVPRGMRATVEAKGFLFGGPTGSKATFTSTSTGLNSELNYVTPPGGMVMVEQQRLTVRDLLAVGQTTQSSISYIKETSFTNAADMVAEEGEKPEATLATEDATAPVKKIAVVLRVTDEMFADFPQLRDYINARLRFMVEAKEEQQLLNGTGAGNQITGILQTSGIQTQAQGSDTNPDAIYKAKTKIRTVGFYQPDGIVINPTDWELIKLKKDSNGQYYGGGPFTGPYGVGGIAGDTLWGLRVVETTAIAAGTALVGAFRLGAQIWQREGITVDATNSNEDDFIHNRVTLRVEERLALAVYRPLAFCTVTGLDSTG